MKTDLITRLFATVQSLEKCLENSKRMLTEQKGQPRSVHTSITQQEKVVRQMRRTANKLQFAVAKNNWQSAIREVRIFEGLWNMVRPEIVATFSALANHQVAIQFSESEAVVH